MTDIYDDIASTKELHGGVARVDDVSGDVFLDMPDGKTFRLKGGIFHGLYGKAGFVDAMRVK
jgi:hypothetical protein